MNSSPEFSTFAPRLQVGSPMSKALTIVGMVVAGLIGLLFAVDWAVGVPVQRGRLADEPRRVSRAGCWAI